MKRTLLLLLAAALMLGVLTGGTCERYDRKMKKLEYKRQLIDSMRRLSQQRKDSIRKAREKEQVLLPADSTKK